MSNSLQSHELQHSRPLCPPLCPFSSVQFSSVAQSCLTLCQNQFSSVQFSSITQSCLTLCDPMYYSMPGLPVHHQLSEFIQTHVHWVGDVIQPSHPVFPFSSRLQSFPASGTFPMTQFFASGGPSIGASASASGLPVNIQDGLVGFPCSPRDSSESSPTT